MHPQSTSPKIISQKIKKGSTKQANKITNTLKNNPLSDNENASTKHFPKNIFHKKNKNGAKREKNRITKTLKNNPLSGTENASTMHFPKKYLSKKIKMGPKKRRTGSRTLSKIIHFGTMKMNEQNTSPKISFKKK